MWNRDFGYEALRVMLTLAAPVGLLVLSWPLLSNLDKSEWALQAMAGYLPYMALGVALGLALWFHKSRAAFAAILLMIGHWMVSKFVASGPDAGVNGQVIYAAYCLLLPINLATFSLIQDRGVFSEYGVSRLAAIATQWAVVVALATATSWLPSSTGLELQRLAAEALHLRWLPPSVDAWTPLPQPALNSFAIAAMILVGRAIWLRERPLEGALAGTLVAAFVALHLVGKGQGATVFFTAAGLMIAVALIQESYRMAYLDDLTGLPARRALLADMAKLGEHYVLVMADVDHFKKFNDTYGHDVGDQVLKMVAAKLARVGGGGRAYRYGGEEFTIVFPSRGHDETKRHLEALLIRIANAEFTLRSLDRPLDKPEAGRKGKKAAEQQTTVSVTVSMGMAEPRGKDMSPDDVLKAADQALYRAKQAGRNRIC